MDEWKEWTISDLAAPGQHSLATGPFGSAISSRFFRDIGVPVIRGSNLSLEIGKRLIEDDLVFVDEPKALEFERSIARRGDLVFTCWGTIGQVGLVDQTSAHDRYIVSNKQMKLTPNPEIAEPLFLYYALSSPHSVAQINNSAIGSSVPGFNLSQLRKFALPLPPLTEQRAITHILGALDDKIAANEQISSCAEQLIRLIYEATTDHAESSPIGSFGTHIRAGVKPSELSGQEAYLGLEHMPRKKIWLDSWGSASEVTSAKNSFRAGDILFGKLRPYFHKVGLAQTGGICSTDIAVIRPVQELWRSWLLFTLSSDEVVAYASSRSGGTRMPRTKWSDLAAYEAPWPGTERVAEFENKTRPVIDRAESATRESRTLAALRDTLLPKLISGEIRIKDAEREVSDAV